MSPPTTNAAPAAATSAAAAATAAIACPRPRGLEHCQRRARERRSRPCSSIAAATCAAGAGTAGADNAGASAGIAAAPGADGAAVTVAVDDSTSVNSAGVRRSDVKALPLNEQVTGELCLGSVRFFVASFCVFLCVFFTVGVFFSTAMYLPVGTSKQESEKMRAFV